MSKFELKGGEVRDLKSFIAKEKRAKMLRFQHGALLAAHGLKLEWSLEGRYRVRVDQSVTYIGADFEAALTEYNRIASSEDSLA